METETISCRRFVDLVGRLGTFCLRRRREGTSWFTPEGWLAVELLRDGEWRHFLCR